MFTSNVDPVGRHEKQNHSQNMKHSKRTHDSEWHDRDSWDEEKSTNSQKSRRRSHSSERNHKRYKSLKTADREKEGKGSFVSNKCALSNVEKNRLELGGRDLWQMGPGNLRAAEGRKQASKKKIENTFSYLDYSSTHERNRHDRRYVEEYRNDFHDVDDDHRHYHRDDEKSHCHHYSKSSGQSRKSSHKRKHKKHGSSYSSHLKSHRRKRSRSVEDDEEGHLICQSGDVLRARCIEYFSTLLKKTFQQNICLE
ncbi:Dual specificity protein kinase CLK4 [Varanus komodoensis]|nr:Dual specificity protein kinase CLK4 [Varanus komodoensis]